MSRKSALILKSNATLKINDSSIKLTQNTMDHEEIRNSFAMFQEKTSLKASKENFDFVFRKCLFEEKGKNETEDCYTIQNSYANEERN